MRVSVSCSSPTISTRRCFSVSASSSWGRRAAGSGARPMSVCPIRAAATTARSGCSTQSSKMPFTRPNRQPDPDDPAALRGAALADAFVAAEHRRRRRAVLGHAARNVLGLILFLAFWEAIPRLVPDLNVLMFPPPSMVIETALPMIFSGELAQNIAISLFRAGAGFLLAAVFGITAGLLTARIR